MTDHKQPEQYVSTTALAKKMGKEAREVFSLLSDGGWLIKVDKRWQLTNKGRFEGGVLLEHPRFGEYVAWPARVLEHPILRSLPDGQWTASRLGAKWGLSGRLLNLALQDLGLIRPGVKGWLLLPTAKRLGAHQSYADKTGVPFISWPDDILHYEPLLSLLSCLKTGCGSLSGRQLSSKGLQIIDNWLYLQGFHYRICEVSAQTRGDFYFPHHHISIITCKPSDNAAAIAKRLAELEKLREEGVACIEWPLEDAVDLKVLDEQLSKLLLQVGIASIH